MNVSCTASAPEPSALQISFSPDRVDVNVTWRPSGAKWAMRVPSSRGDRDRWWGGCGRAGRRGLDAPDVGVGVTADVHKARRAVSLGTRDDGRQPVLTHKRQPLRRPVAGDPEPPQARLHAEQDLGAVRRPPGVVRRQVGRCQATRLARRSQVLRERQQSELASERRDLAAEGQPLAIRRERGIGVGRNPES